MSKLSSLVYLKLCFIVVFQHSPLKEELDTLNKQRAEEADDLNQKSFVKSVTYTKVMEETRVDTKQGDFSSTKINVRNFFWMKLVATISVQHKSLTQCASCWFFEVLSS